MVMPRASYCTLAGLAVCLAIMPKNSRAAEKQTVHVFERTVTRTLGYKYLLALPDGYAADRARRWPLLVFLHGSGERGDDVWTIALHGPPKILQARAPADAAAALAQNFIVVSPQCPKNEWWDPDAVLALIDETIAHQRVDLRRVYLTGLSMGGFATWDLGLGHPERFAAIAPVCGGGSFAPAFMSNTHRRADLRSLGVWAFHGAKDDAVPVAESERMIARLKEYKVRDVQLTVYPEAQHDSWTETYANPELYAWLLRHVRPANK